MEFDRLTNLFRALLTSLQSNQLDALYQELKKRFHSDWQHYGLCRDLTKSFKEPYSQIPISVRKLHNDDIPRLLNLAMPKISDRGPYVRMHRLNFISSGIGTCYVAVTNDNTPCYMQWLLNSHDNDRIQQYFKGIFPILAADEALLEYAFTLENFQGYGIMPAAMAQIALKAQSIGARYVLTFVDSKNVPALKGCKRAGFEPRLIRTDKWRLFKRVYVFNELPEGTSFPFGD